MLLSSLQLFLSITATECTILKRWFDFDFLNFTCFTKSDIPFSKLIYGFFLSIVHPLLYCKLYFKYDRASDGFTYVCTPIHKPGVLDMKEVCFLLVIYPLTRFFHIRLRFHPWHITVFPANLNKNISVITLQTLYLVCLFCNDNGKGIRDTCCQTAGSLTPMATFVCQTTFITNT